MRLHDHMNLKDMIIHSITLLMVLVFFLMTGVICVNADSTSSTTQSPAVQPYEIQEDNDISLSDSSAVNKFSYGKNAVGHFALSNTDDRVSEYDGCKTYFAEGPVSFNYSYDGSYQTENKEEWNLASYDSKKIGDIKTKKNGKSGEVLIQKSEDGKKWETVADCADFFKENPNGKDGIYTASEDELMQGTYYRVIVAYQMKRKTGVINETVSKIPGLGSLVDKYQVINCAEVYKFYLSYGKNPVTLQDIGSTKDVSDSATVQRGFKILKNHSGATVTVSYNDRTEEKAKDYASFYEPGQYVITTVCRTGEKYHSNIQVTEGMKVTAVKPKVFATEKKRDGYDKGTEIKRSTAAGIQSLSSLSIGQTGGDDIEVLNNAELDCDAYGISGSGVSLFMNLDAAKKLKDNGWEIAADDWGKRKSQTVAGTYTGTVNSGALIVKTSKDGQNWKDVAREKYANGLTTTDFGNNWADKGNICIYTPNGSDVLNGIYIRVYYAYMAQNSTDKKSSYRALEEYEFYLCESDLGAVTFHNLSLNKKSSASKNDKDKTTAEIHQRAETLTSGSGTVTGFSVDLSGNPTADYSIKKDGKQIAKASDDEYTETGRYDIHLTSPSGKTKDVVLFVDTQTNDDAMKMYFGNSFVDANSKRIFSEEGEYPVYEGGSLFYNVEATDDSYLPISGEITNLTTGKVITVPATHKAKNGTINEAGEYEAIFTTNPEYEEEKESGDQRIFTFRFDVIAKGTAPGPQMNKKYLKEYAQSTAADAYPIYYGLTYPGASKGRITLAFKTREAAIEYAYQYQKGTVEEQEDGTFRYTGSSNDQKHTYTDIWDLTEDINEFAEKEVKTLYFDMSDPFTYQTLSEENLSKNENLSKLELQNSVVVFADEAQKEKLTGDASELPLLSPKPYAIVINPEKSNESVKQETKDFQFIKDKDGYDSDQVVITDCTGKEFNIAYDKNVGSQLKADNCAAGVVTIHESTRYGDSTEYNAIYIPKGKNTAEIGIDYYEDDEKKTRMITQADDGAEIEAEAFSIASVKDALDPSDLILVAKDGEITPYAGDQTIQDAWSDEGKYNIKVVNRIGASFSFSVNVKKDNRRL